MRNESKISYIVSVDHQLRKVRVRVHNKLKLINDLKFIVRKSLLVGLNRRPFAYKDDRNKTIEEKCAINQNEL